MVVLIILGAFFALGIGFGLAAAVKEKASNTTLRLALEKRKRNLEYLDQKLKDRDEAFKKGFLPGRRWLAEVIADADLAIDSASEDYLKTKQRPAIKAAEVLSQLKTEKRDIKLRLKFLEFQLKSYEEYFPFLEEYRDFILDERIPLNNGQDNLEKIETADPTLQFISREEYERLDTTERNQLALDKYISRPKSNWEIGRLYERYLGYLYERDGWRVEFHGAIKGYDDFGRDLICRKGASIEIVQAKCWSKNKVIHEKHIFQLYGTCVHFRLDCPSMNVRPVFTTTTELSEPARLVSEVLRIRVDKIELPASYPMVKCNVNLSSREKIYHLPFDQQYDRAAIGAVPGECYVSTVKEAEQLKFRRAWRWSGLSSLED